MSVSYGAYLVSGVLLNDLVKINTEIRNQYMMHDQKTGKPTGLMSSGEKVHVLKFPNGKTCEIPGKISNGEISELKEFRGLDCFYDYETDSTENFLVGKKIVQGGDMNSSSTNNIVSEEQIKKTKGDVLKILNENFGYDGEIKLSLTTYCSY